MRVSNQPKRDINKPFNPISYRNGNIVSNQPKRDINKILYTGRNHEESVSNQPKRDINLDDVLESLLSSLFRINQRGI